MQALKFWLVGTILLVACGGAPSPVTSAPATPALSAVPTPAAPSMTACRAVPSTLYGEETVSFELAGPRSSTAVEVRDAAGRTLARQTVVVPGTWQVPDLGSGDFSLLEPASGVTCTVTVNRELPRASSTAR